MKKYVDGTYQNMFFDLRKFPTIEILTYTKYLKADDKLIITKGTLDEIIEAFPLDLKRIAGFDENKVQTLKQSGGSLMWIDDDL